MIIQIISKIKSEASDDEIFQIMEERVPHFRAVPGLIQKYYTQDQATGEFSGIYLWDSIDSLKAFRETELAQTIVSAYKLVGQPRVETLEVLFQLHGADPVQASGEMVSRTS